MLLGCERNCVCRILHCLAIGVVGKIAPFPAFFCFIGDTPLALSILKFADDFRYRASVFVGKGSQAAILHQIGQITQPIKVACQVVVIADSPSSAPTTIIKTDINGYMSFLLSNSDLLISNLLAANSISCCLRTASPQGIAALAAQGGVATLTERSDATFSVEQFSSADRE